MLKLFFFLQEDQEVHSHLAEDDQYFAVELARGQRGFGFSIRGGREFHSMPLFVLRMAVDGEKKHLSCHVLSQFLHIFGNLTLILISGPAALDGRLRVGDQLIEINGHTTKNMTHGEAIELIKNGGLAVRLLVRRARAPNTAFLGMYHHPARHSLDGS